MFAATLKQYLPNVRDQSSRESLLTQVLYCAGSLGRLGGDFSLMLAMLEEDDDEGDEDEEGDGEKGDGEKGEKEEKEEEEEEKDWEWVEVMRKHRVLAGKLEQLASGVGGVGKSGSGIGGGGERATTTTTASTSPSIT